MTINKKHRRMLLHIGFPKAASTTFQNTVFPEAKKYAYLGKDNGTEGNKHLLPVSKFIYDLAFAEDRELHNSYSNFDTFIRSEVFRRYGAIDSSVPLFLSHELFLAVLLKPINSRHGLYTGDAAKIFRRLCEFAQLYKYCMEFIIIKRCMKDLVFSWYAQGYSIYHLTPTTNSLNKYLRSEIGLDFIKSGLFWFYKENLESLLCDIFGKENIHVFDFHELLENKNSESYKNMQTLLDVNLPDFKHTVFNKRSDGLNRKIGTLVATSRSRKSFLESINLAWHTFKLNYYKSCKLSKIIEWDNDSDLLYQQMIKKFEQETVAYDQKLLPSQR